MFVAGTRTFSKRDFAMAVRSVIVAEHRQHPLDLDPGVSIGTRIIDCCLCVGADGSVLPMKMAILQRGSPAPEVHHLRPLITYLRRRARCSTGCWWRRRRRRPAPSCKSTNESRRREVASSHCPSLFRRAVAREHFHVARVGRRTVEHFGSHVAAAHDFAQRRVFEIGQPGALFVIRAETDSTARQRAPLALALR